MHQMSSMASSWPHTISFRLMWAVLPLLAACSGQEPPAQVPPAVVVAAVVEQSVPIYSEWVGQTVGSVTTEVRARVEGIVEDVVFQEGMPVRSGQILYRIDPSIYTAQVRQAEGELARAEAGLAKAQADVNRYRPLVAANAISREEYETAVSIQAAAEASVRAARAVVASRQLEVDFATVRAPISGVAGKSMVQRGALVGRGDNTLLTTVSTVNPIRVRFSVSEQEVLEFRRRQLDKKDRNLELRLILADGTSFPYPGRLVLADNAVDAATGTLLLEAEFPNPEFLLQPGQFARVRAITQQVDRAIVIPQRSVSELQGTARVAVVSDSSTVAYRTVTIGARVGSAYVVTSGLRKGERIVIEGLQRVQDGFRVSPKVGEYDVDSLLRRN